MANTIVKPCTCKSSYQDTTYGPGLRLKNVGGTRESPKYSCTVCSVSGEGPKKAKSGK